MLRHPLLQALAPLACGAALLMTALPAEAHRRGAHVGVGVHAGGYHAAPHWRGQGHWAPRHHGGRIGIGIGLGGFYPYAYGAPWGYGGYMPGYVIVPPAPRIVYADPLGPEPALPVGPPEPLYEPRRGQTPEQTEADIRDCQRWALGQPDAVARADVLHQATLACMDGRGYAVR